MSVSKGATIYFDPDLHRAVRLKAAATERSISDVGNQAVRQALAEDSEDLEAFDERASEPDLDFESVVRSLKQRNKV